MIEFVTKKTVFDALSAANLSPAEITVVDIEAAGVGAAAAPLEMARIALAGPDNRLLSNALQDTNELYRLDNAKEPGSAKGLAAGDAITGESLNGAFSAVLVIAALDGESNEALQGRLEALARLVRPGGLLVVGLQFYIEAEPGDYWRARHAKLKAFGESDSMTLIGRTAMDAPRFEPHLASASDANAFSLYRTSSVMKTLRMTGQNVGLVCGYRKVG